DAGTVDAGAVDAGAVDAGAVDAGAVDAGAVDAGAVDAGAVDAGTVDAGRSPFAPDFDAGACPPLLHPVPPGAAVSPRADPIAELMVLHADPSRWFVDDASYERVLRDRALIEQLDAGPLNYIPTWGFSLLLQFDAPLRLREYHAWDCLNWAWRGAPNISEWDPPTTTRDHVFVTIAPIVSLPQLAEDYATLPHVTSVSQNGFGVVAWCGAAADSCLTIDGQRWRWLWYTESRSCARQWYRLETRDDGGIAVFERWTDGGLPTPWLDEVPSCWDELWGAAGHRPRDAGSP
ncbi:MAG: hypothetical protein ACOZQL_29140, partial [Myxococcota bacterium]